MSRSRIRYWLGGALLAGGVLFLGYAGLVRWREHETQSRTRRALHGTHTLPSKPHRGDTLGELRIPRLHLSVMVLEGDDEAILDRAAGHIPETALPGSPGNVAIAAHRDTFFRALRLIRPRDEIVLETPAGTRRFSVSGTEVVKPEDTAVLLPGPQRDLTLVTCFPFSYVGPAPERFIVHAVRVS